MRPKRMSAISRRDWLKGLAGLGAAATLSGCSGMVGDSRHKTLSGPSADFIRRENQRPGTRDWLLNKTGIDPRTTYRCPWIEGFVSRTSVRAGDSLNLFVSMN